MSIILRQKELLEASYPPEQLRAWAADGNRDLELSESSYLLYKLLSELPSLQQRVVLDPQGFKIHEAYGKIHAFTPEQLAHLRTLSDDVGRADATLISPMTLSSAHFLSLILEFKQGILISGTILNSTGDPTCTDWGQWDQENLQKYLPLIESITKAFGQPHAIFNYHTSQRQASNTGCGIMHVHNVRNYLTDPDYLNTHHAGVISMNDEMALRHYYGKVLSALPDQAISSYPVPTTSATISQAGPSQSNSSRSSLHDSHLTETQLLTNGLLSEQYPQMSDDQRSILARACESVFADNPMDIIDQAHLTDTLKESLEALQISSSTSTDFKEFLMIVNQDMLRSHSATEITKAYRQLVHDKSHPGPEQSSLDLSLFQQNPNVSEIFVPILEDQYPSITAELVRHLFSLCQSLVVNDNLYDMIVNKKSSFTDKLHTLVSHADHLGHLSALSDYVHQFDLDLIMALEPDDLNTGFDVFISNRPTVG